jgi:hypothetical protein
VSRYRKCLHYYWYTIHPECGFLNVRLRTWFPFEVQICLNGREWLARQLDAVGLPYERHDNCFTDVADFAQAQALLAAQLRTDWPTLLEGLAQRVNPLREELFGDLCPGYYWSTYQSEWATSSLLVSAEARYSMGNSHAFAEARHACLIRSVTAWACAPNSFNSTVRADR